MAVHAGGDCQDWAPKGCVLLLGWGLLGGQACHAVLWVYLQVVLLGFAAGAAAEAVLGGCAGVCCAMQCWLGLQQDSVCLRYELERMHSNVLRTRLPYSVFE